MNTNAAMPFHNQGHPASTGNRLRQLALSLVLLVSCGSETPPEVSEVCFRLITETCASDELGHPSAFLDACESELSQRSPAVQECFAGAATCDDAKTDCGAIPGTPDPVVSEEPVIEEEPPPVQEPGSNDPVDPYQACFDSAPFTSWGEACAYDCVHSDMCPSYNLQTSCSSCVNNCAEIAAGDTGVQSVLLSLYSACGSQTSCDWVNCVGEQTGKRQPWHGGVVQ